MKHVPQFAKWVGARRRTGLFAATTIAVLVLAGGALAWHGSSSASLVSATFSANTVTGSQSKTCTAANNDSIQVTEASFTGTASSADAHLTGPLTIHAISVYDATTNAGTVSGDVVIGTGFQGHFMTINAHGALQGLLTGWENGAGQLVGNLSSSFSAAGGFGSSNSLATIGSGTATNTAIVSTSGCAGASSDDDNDDDDQGHNTPGGKGTFGSHASVGGSSSEHHHSGGDNQQ
jgi:hypothetical protein